MRVGLVIYGTLDTISGGYLYDRMLVEYLRRKGDEVEIVSLPRRNYHRHLSDNFSRSLQKRLRHAKWDALLQDELNHPSLWRLNHRLKRKISYPIIAIVHHLRCCECRADWKTRFYRAIEKRYLDSVDGFIFNSQTTRSEVERLTGGAKPFVVAYPGRDRFNRSTNPSQIAERARQPGPLRILFLGNVIRRKGLHTLIDALSLLSDKSWQLEVVGSLSVEASYVRSIRRHIAKAGLDSKIRFRGLLADAELEECLSRSQLLAVPSSYEGFGIVYLEAMAFGLPVIASTAGAAYELITNEKEGFLISPDDPPALVERIRTLSQNRDLLIHMSLRAYEHHQHFPTWEQSTARIREFLRG